MRARRAALRLVAVWLVLVGLRGCLPPALGDPGLVITRGGTYGGTWTSPHPAVPAILIRTDAPVVLDGVEVSGPGPLIRTATGVPVDLVVRGAVGRGPGAPPAGASPGRFLHVDRFRRVVVERSTLLGTAGIYLHDGVDGATARIVRNRAVDIDGRVADGEGGYRDARYVQFVQIDRSASLRETVIAWNHVTQHPFASRVEDVISLHASSGLPSDPVRVHDNLIEGAFPADPARDGYSGGGIMLGDGGGSHLRATDNHVVGTANYGIAISGGSDNRIDRNRVVACGLLPDGRPVASANVGIYVWNLRDAPGFERNGGAENEVAYLRAGERNDWWVPDADAWTSNRRLALAPSAPCAAEADEVRRWRAKADRAGVEVGAPVAPGAPSLDGP